MPWNFPHLLKVSSEVSIAQFILRHSGKNIFIHSFSTCGLAAFRKSHKSYIHHFSPLLVVFQKFFCQTTVTGTCIWWEKDFLAQHCNSPHVILYSTEFLIVNNRPYTFCLNFIPQTATTI